MHLMLVNDDGIHAEGIRALCAAAAAAGHRVSVCAPDRERSAAGHAITLTAPLAARKVEMAGAEVAYAVNGTPADCARLGLYLIPDVDLVISGVNNGANLGSACVYSGTVSAAQEAAMKGKPAMAASLCARGAAEFDTAARVTVRVAEWMRNHPLPRGAVYSVNIPMLPMKEIKGIRAARLAPNYLDTPLYREISTPDGIQYQYIHGRDVVPLDKPEYDIVLVGEGYVTVTKLTWDMRLNAPDPEIPDAILTEVRHEPV